ncbi:unnamed protein product [Peniophora sp. CBMAI 1063]|nr:unnamed protein product [Peniophora sp. CBMAI 1063]
MAEETSISPWSSLVNSRFSESALSRVPPGLRLQTLDAELKDVEKALIDARRLRNLNTWPCKLPAEVLICIFEWLQPMWPPERHRTESGQTYSAGWMSVMHVCSMWREIVIGVPSLWFKPTWNIFDVAPQFIPDIISQSQLNPLDLSIDWCDQLGGVLDDTDRATWLSSSILRRAGCLAIAAETEDLVLIAARLPPGHEMQQLRRLSVVFIYTGEDPVLPSSLKSLSGLTELNLQNVQIPWHSPILSPSLTDLYLSQNEGDMQPSHDDIVGLAASLVSLKKLHLEDVVPLPEPVRERSLPIVFSASLRSIDVLSPCEELAADAFVFFSRVNTPRRCTQEFYIPVVGKPHSPDMSLADKILKEHIPRFSFATDTNIDAHCLDLSVISIRILGVESGQPESASQHPWPSDSDPRYTKHYLQFFEYEKPAPLRMSKYLASVALRSLHNLALDIPTIRDLCSDNAWPCLLRASEVRRVGVLKPSKTWMCQHISILLDALVGHHARDGQNEAGVLFPRLEVVALPLFEKEAEYSGLKANIVNLVHARRELGVPVQELVIPESASAWSMWSTMRTYLKITPVDYPWTENASPFVYDSDTVYDSDSEYDSDPM